MAPVQTIYEKTPESGGHEEVLYRGLEATAQKAETVL